VKEEKKKEVKFNVLLEDFRQSSDSLKKSIKEILKTSPNK